jgi:O-methyltransferase
VTAGSEVRIRDRYLDLLIGALTHTIYAGVDLEETPDPIREEPGRRRAEGRDVPRYAQTMVGLERLRNVRRCVETALADGVPGDLIEAGAWRGGVGILMRAVLEAHGDEDRQVFVADSFRGLPAPNRERYPAEREIRPDLLRALAVPLEEARENFRRYGLLDRRVHFVEGWFHDSLPPLRGNAWAVVRLDGDLYESTIDSLTHLYDDLSSGGFLIVDDFALSPCREAVEDFRRDRDIDEPIEEIDWTGVFWRKRA